MRIKITLVTVAIALAFVIGMFVGSIKHQKRLERHNTDANADPAANRQKNKDRFKDNADDVNRNPSKIIYTKHARCRMQCRKFTEQEVKEILSNGKINYNKSNDRPGACPTYALEGTTSDGQRSRMVFAFCNDTEAKVVTVIDLDTDWPCSCD